MCLPCFFLYQSCIPNVTRVRKGPAGGVKHHHLPSTHRHPQLTWNTHTCTWSIYQSLLNSLSKSCGFQLQVFTLSGATWRMWIPTKTIFLLPDSTLASTVRFPLTYLLLFKSTAGGEKQKVTSCISLEERGRGTVGSTGEGESWV